MKIAIFNATKKIADIVDSNLQVQNYWRGLEAHERVYVLENVAFVDATVLADYTHEDFIADGWEVLQ